eukprot:Skav215156  [mRNA]  locus=scaffold1997:53184:55635:+ [translate_table: standard]
MEESTWTLPSSMLSWIALTSCSCDTTTVGAQDTELRATTTSMPEVHPAIKTIEAVEATTLQTVADLKSDIQKKEQIPVQDGTTIGSLGSSVSQLLLPLISL